MCPKVSVIIPVYNHEEYIKECVDSALAQKNCDLEVIVVDDGSTDGTRRILEGFGDKIVAVLQENQGTSAALNAGLERAQGSLVGWLSSDDLYLPGKIAAQVGEFERTPSLALVYTDWIMIDSHGRELSVVRSPCPPPSSFVREMLGGNFVNGSSALIRRECLEEVGYFDTSLAAGSDVEMWFRLLNRGYKFGHFPIPLMKYRWHLGNLSHDYSLLQACKDRVLTNVIRDFAPKRLFGVTPDEDRNTVSKAYTALARDLTRQFVFGAASLSLLKATTLGGNSLQRSCFSASLRLLNTKLSRKILAFVRRTRRVRIDKLKQKQLGE